MWKKEKGRAFKQNAGFVRLYFSNFVVVLKASF
jgi:hypothetical protein